MAAPPVTEKRPTSAGSASQPPAYQPYIAASSTIPEFTWTAVTAGVILGILFGASSLYLVLKVGMTVSASIPVAVLSITLFRGLAKAFGLRPATILENNIVQTTGSAGESIAFGLAVTIPALLLLGHDMTIVRVMVVGSLGGLLGILMMIPLRRAFVVQQHGLLRYPEGTACAEVLIVGEEGGSTARAVFAGFGLAFVHKFAMKALGLWPEDVSAPLFTNSGPGYVPTAQSKGLVGGILGGELSPELLGVGYIIGPRIASIMMAGGVLAYLVLVPMITFFGSQLTQSLPPAASGDLIRDMTLRSIRDNYILYIGAGAVATGGIISMVQTLPVIFGSFRSALGDLSKSGADKDRGRSVPRTERDLPLSFVFFGSIGLVLAMASAPQLGLGFTVEGLVGALFIVLFGFLFVTVSSRLTGEVGSSSNPISGMTVATLLFTCLGFVVMGHVGYGATLTALTVAAVVCVAASNGGTTSQDLKTGFLVGATPRLQQIAILIGALTSALVIGAFLLVLNNAGTVYTKNPKYLPRTRIDKVDELTQMEHVGGEYAGKDGTLYHVLHAREGEYDSVKAGRYLVDNNGRVAYYVDPGINGKLTNRDDGEKVSNKFEAPKTRLMAIIIDGIMNGKLPWELVLLGVLVAVVLELAGVPSLPFAVGVYLPLHTSVPIFIGGLVRYAVDRTKRREQGDASPGVLLSSGYIAGGSIAGVLLAVLSMPQLDRFNKWLNVGSNANWFATPLADSKYWPSSLAAFALLVVVLAMTGLLASLQDRSPQRRNP